MVKSKAAPNGNSSEVYSPSREKAATVESIQEELKQTKKLLKKSIEVVERCWVIDTMNIKMQNQVGGIPIESAYKNELERSKKEKSEIQELVEKALETINQTSIHVRDL